MVLQVAKKRFGGMAKEKKRVLSKIEGGLMKESTRCRTSGLTIFPGGNAKVRKP